MFSRPVNQPNDKIRPMVPDATSGYELTKEEFGFFSVIIPEETCNLVSNPCPVNNTSTGYTSSNSSVTVSTDYTYIGPSVLKIVPTNKTASSGVYYDIALTNTNVYTFSVFVRARNEEKIMVYAANNSGTRVDHFKILSGNNNFTRVSITFKANSPGNHRLYVMKQAGQSVNPFYVSGFQCEQKSYPTTYVDGYTSRKYFSFTSSPDTPDIFWSGIPYASTSWRKSSSRVGGISYSFHELGISVVGVIGLGNIPSDNVMDETNIGYSYYQKSIARKRTFSIVCKLFDKSISDIAKKRELLINAISPINNKFDAPILIQYNILDKYGKVCKIFDIECIYVSGMEGNFSNYYQDSFNIQFEMADSFVKDYGETFVESGLYTELASPSLTMLKLSSTGVLSNLLSTSAYPSIPYFVYNDYLYCGHTIANVNGVANTESAYRLNLTTLIAEPIINGYTIASVATRFYLDKQNSVIYITHNDTINGCNCISKYDPATKTTTALGTGADAAAKYISDVLVQDDGTIIVCGSFTSMGGVANTGNIAKWNGSAWVSIQALTFVANPHTGVKEVECISSDGKYLYFGGEFSVSGVAGTQGIFRLDSTGASSVGGGMYDYGSSDMRVTKIVKTSDGSMYVLGSFGKVGWNGIWAINIAKWNGSSYSSVINIERCYNPYNGSAFTSGNAYDLFEHKGNVYISGLFNYVNGVKVNQGIVKLVVNTPMPLNFVNSTVLPQTAFTLWCRAISDGDNIYIGTYPIAGPSKTIYSSISTINLVNNSTAKVYPYIEVLGPGVIYNICNLTTDKNLFLRSYIDVLLKYVDNVFIQGGEYLSINLRKDRFGISSSNSRVGIKNIGDGTDLDWYLSPGTNLISVLMPDSTGANTKFKIGWRNTYLSLDSAIKENRFAK